MDNFRRHCLSYISSLPSSTITKSTCSRTRFSRPSIISIIFPNTMATHWYCGHCHHGPMMMTTNEHCVLCFRRRDTYAIYEQSSIASTAPPNQSDTSPVRIKCCDGGLIAFQHESELLAEMRAKVSVSAQPWWYCCQCKESNVIAVFTGLMVNIGGDGPKYIKTEVKCLGCDHEMCKQCVKA